MYADALMGIARRKEGSGMLVTGGPPNFGGGMPQRISVISRPSLSRITGTA
jgi:hypothetical protein